MTVLELASAAAKAIRSAQTSHAGDVPVPIAPLMLLTFEPSHCVMEGAMLLGIKQRAEQGAVEPRARALALAYVRDSVRGAKQSRRWCGQTAWLVHVARTLKLGVAVVRAGYS